MAAVNDIMEARIVCELPPQIAVNVWHLRIDTIAGTGATDLQIATAIDSLIAVDFKGILSDDAVYRGVGVKKIFPLPIGVEAASVASAGAGTTVGTILPKQIAGVISKRTILPGAQGRGRMYVPWPNEEHSETPGVPTLAYRTSLGILGGLFVGTKTAGTVPNQNTFVFGVWSKTGEVFNVLTQVIVRSKWGTQRRRGDFGRSNTVPF